MTELHTLGQRIYFARVWRGKQTLAAFGAAVAEAEKRAKPYTPQAVAEWESNTTIPKLSALQAIPKVAGLRPEWLILKSGQPTGAP